MVRGAGHPRTGTVDSMIDVLVNGAAVVGGVVLFLMTLSVAVLPLLQEWGESR